MLRIFLQSFSFTLRNDTFFLIKPFIMMDLFFGKLDSSATLQSKGHINACRRD